uniref:Lectin/glucanase superfamily protein n=1 Tax=viral metagenome TaxID=1070528 RepID=A0A6C0E583_9ZZZZ
MDWSAAGNYLNQLQPQSDTVKYVMYVLIIGITVATLLVIVDAFYPFLPINPIGGPSAEARAGRSFWTNVTTEMDGLVVAKADSPIVSPGAYSMSVQVVIADSRSMDQTKFRHILSAGTSDISADGLPSIMNPGIFLDKRTNDVHVFINTILTTGTTITPLQEGMTIKDLPLGNPITLGVVNNGRTVEVYVNCRLYSTLLLKGTPVAAPPDQTIQWFGRLPPAPFTGIIKNLQLWGTALNSTDFIQMCRVGTVALSDLPNAVCSKSS